MILKHPWFLLALLLLIPVIWFHISRRRKSNPTLEVSSLSGINKVKKSLKVRLLSLEFYMRLAVLALLVIALTRPQLPDHNLDSTINGTDIVLAMDVSGSMEYPDLSPNRIEAARQIAANFVKQRENDNMGLVAFAGESLTFMPLTTDHAAMLNAIRMLNVGILGGNTAIGDGLINAINRALSGTAVSKTVILLTDGSNNAGEIDPITAANVAKEKGVRVYTIGIGSDQQSSGDIMFYGGQGADWSIDTSALEKVADITGGKFFMAKDNATLRNIFNEIDKLERSHIQTTSYVRMDDISYIFCLIALLIILINTSVRYSILRRIP